MHASLFRVGEAELSVGLLGKALFRSRRGYQETIGSGKMQGSILNYKKPASLCYL